MSLIQSGLLTHVQNEDVSSTSYAAATEAALQNEGFAWLGSSWEYKHIQPEIQFKDWTRQAVTKQLKGTQHVDVDSFQTCMVDVLLLLLS